MKQPTTVRFLITVYPCPGELTGQPLFRAECKPLGFETNEQKRYNAVDSLISQIRSHYAATFIEKPVNLDIAVQWTERKGG